MLQSAKQRKELLSMNNSEKMATIFNNSPEYIKVLLENYLEAIQQNQSVFPECPEKMIQKSS